jgi:hypothetical protein
MHECFKVVVIGGAVRNTGAPANALPDPDCKSIFRIHSSTRCAYHRMPSNEIDNSVAFDPATSTFSTNTVVPAYPVEFQKLESVPRDSMSRVQSQCTVDGIWYRSLFDQPSSPHLERFDLKSKTHLSPLPIPLARLVGDGIPDEFDHTLVHQSPEHMCALPNGDILMINTGEGFVRVFNPLTGICYFIQNMKVFLLPFFVLQVSL